MSLPRENKGGAMLLLRLLLTLLEVLLVARRGRDTPRLLLTLARLAPPTCRRVTLLLLFLGVSVRGARMSLAALLS